MVCSMTGVIYGCIQPSSKEHLRSALELLSENQADTFSSARSELKTTSDFAELIPFLVAPEQLVDLAPPDRFERLLDEKLSKSSSIFSRISSVIKNIITFQKRFPHSASLANIKAVYESFVKEACAKKGEERGLILEGPVRLISPLLGPHILSQNLAREIALASSAGTAIVQRTEGLRSLHFWGVPALAGEQILFDTFLFAISGLESLPSIPIKLRNVRVQSLGKDRDGGQMQNNSSLIYLVTLASQDESQKVVMNHPPQNIQQDGFTFHFLTTLLLRARKSDESPYRCTSSGALINMGGSALFSQASIDPNGVNLPAFYSSLFSLPAMALRLSPAAAAKVTSLAEHSPLFIIQWLKAVVAEHRAMNPMPDEEIFTESEFQALSLPPTCSLVDLKRIQRQIDTLRTLLTRSPLPTHWEIFDALYPDLSRYLQSLSKNEIQEKLERQFIDLQKSSINPVEALPIPKLVDRWIQDVDTTSLSREEELTFHETAVSLSETRELSLNQSKLTDSDLLALISRSKVSVLTLNKCLSITVQGLLTLMQGHNEIHIIFSDMTHLTVEDLSSLISRCVALKITCSICVESERWVLDSEHLPLIVTTLMGKGRKKMVEAIVKGGFTLSSVEFGTFLFTQRQMALSPSQIAFLMQQTFTLKTKNKRGETLLHIAAKESDTAMVQFLLGEGITIDEKDNDGKTALHVAAMVGATSVIHTLLQRGANLKATASDQSTALHYAVEYDQQATVQQLLEYQGGNALLTMVDADRKTPLHKAVWGDEKSEVVRLLLEYGAEVDAKNSFGFTPLHWAAKHGHLESAKILWLQGADHQCENGLGDTPVDLAQRWGQDQIAQYFLDPSVLATAEYLQTTIDSTNREKGLKEGFVKAFRESKLADQIIFLERLGDDYLEKEEYIKAAKVFSTIYGALAFYRTNPTFMQFLLKKMERIEGRFLSEQVGKKVPGDYRNQVRKFHEQLDPVRGLARTFLAHRKPIREAQEELTDRFQKIFKGLIEDCVMLMGPPPASYAILSLGAMGRKEMCPYSSFNYVILVGHDSKEVKKYFYDLDQFLRVKIVNLGETFFGVRDTLDAPTNGDPVYGYNPRGFSIQESNECFTYDTLVCTPEDLASYQNLNKLEKNPQAIALASFLRDYQFVTGTQELVTNYANICQTVEATDSQQRTELTSELLKFFSTEFYLALAHFNQRLEVIDVTRDFLSPLQHVIDALAFLHRLPSNSTWNHIENLVGQGKLTVKTGNKLKEALEIIGDIRLSAHMHYNSGDEVKCRDVDPLASGVHTFDEEQQVKFVEIYATLLPLWESVCTFVQGNTKAFDSLKLDATEIITKDSLNARLEKLRNAIKKLTGTTEAAEPQVPKHVQLALGYHLKTLTNRAIKNNGTLPKSAEVAKTNEKIALCFGLLGRTHDAFNYEQKGK